ncbi:uncharacterized protein LOC110458689 [Mizuhopecten yessoensis]|uniref:G-protein coupled receptors family 1 profile domain-containing protein n=1 Tax=Mizuhopecten yessoensis TaxID=6573 RepID=A0A210Q642_MIZYE|nr:uncharacterized protein LOC110458689 [Mizuhopecten yessoensis]OWF44198.1 hypothetical protein KP79_PYT14433 [Mizuhopecten yessoensis]
MTDFNLTTAEAMFTSQLWWPLLIINIVLGGVAISCSLIVILVSRRTSLGDGATLVFVRCLCVTDILTGVCAVSKGLLLMNIDVLSVDCFLPESLFITAITACVLFLLWLNVDCFLHLNKPENMRLHIAKGNIISGMVVVWNVAFILGFLPQMGWNAMDRVCLFLFYYDHLYLLMLVSLWVLIVLCCYWMQALTSRLTTKIKSSRHFLTTNSKVYYKYGGLTGTVHIQLCTMCVCCLPCIGYVVYCFFRYETPENFIWVNGYLPYVLMIFTFRSVLCSFINGYKTSQIRSLMRRVSRSFANTLLRRRFSNYRRRAVRGRNVFRASPSNQQHCWTVQRQFDNSQSCHVCASNSQRSFGSSTCTSISTGCLYCHRTRCLCDVFDVKDHERDRDMDKYGRYGLIKRTKQVTFPFSSDSSSEYNGNVHPGEIQNNALFDKRFTRGNIPLHHPPFIRKTMSCPDDFAHRHHESFNPTFNRSPSSVENDLPNNDHVDYNPSNGRDTSPHSINFSQTKDSHNPTVTQSELLGEDIVGERTDSIESASPSSPKPSKCTTQRLRPPLRQAASLPTSTTNTPPDLKDIADSVDKTLTRKSGTMGYLKRWTLRQAMKIKQYSYDGSNDFRQRVGYRQDGYLGSFDDSKLIFNEGVLTEQTTL